MHALSQPQQQSPKAHLKPKTSGSISEIIVVPRGINSTQTDLTFAMLAHLSHQHKSQENAGQWLTWICPVAIGKEALQKFNFDLTGLRILQPKTEGEIPILMQKALAAGNSHTVVAHCNGINAKLLPWLEETAYKSHCNGLIIRPQSL